MTDGAPQAGPPAPTPVPAAAWIALAVLIVAGAALRLVGLRDQGLLYRDEEVYLFAAETFLADVRAASGTEATPPFESIAALEAAGLARREGPTGVPWPAAVAGVMALAGRPAEWSGRLLAALCGIALIPVAFHLGRRWFGDWQGALALASVSAFVPSLVWWSRLGVPAMLVLLLLHVGVIALLHARTHPPARVAWGACGTAFTLALLTDYAAGYAVLALAVWWLVRAFTGEAPAVLEEVRWTAVGFLVACVLHLPLARGYVVAARAGAYTPLPTFDWLYLPYWFWRREGIIVCLLVAAGMLVALRRRAGSSPAHPPLLLPLLLVLPAVGAAVAVGRDPLARYPVVAVYLPLALLAAGGLRAMVQSRFRDAGYAAAAAVVVVLAVSVVRIVNTRGTAHEVAAWVRAESRAWLRSQGTTEAAVVLVARHMLPPVNYESRRVFQHAVFADPGEQARRVLARTSAYVFLVGEEGRLNPEWSHVSPLTTFSASLPYPALYVSETPGSTASKRARLEAGHYLQLAAYDAAAVAAHRHEHAALSQPNPYAVAVARPGRFHADPVPEPLAPWRTKFRAVLTDTLGISRIERPEHPRVQVTERVPAVGYTRERVELETETGFRVPAFVLLPAADAPAPFVLALHGHGPGKRLLAGLTENSEETRALEEERRDFALALVRRGYAVIAPDQRGFGELRLPDDIARGLPFSCPRLQLQAQLVGRSLIGDRVHDAMRWIDYAQRRDAIDATRIIVAGHSGGGTTALFTAALDDRVDVAFVSGYYGRFATSLGAFDLCECNYAPGIAALGDIPDIAALVAPRRLRLSLGRLDGINPLAIAQEALPRTRAVFDAAGGTVDLAIGDLGHIVYPAHLWSLLEEPAPPVAGPAADPA